MPATGEKTATLKTAGTPRKKAAAAGPRKTRAAAAPRETVGRELVEKALGVITTSLDEDKAEDIVTLDLRGRASFADHMVIATGIADRQIAAMASHVEDKLNEIGIKRITIEGANGTDWVLLDTGDIVVHLFKPESRALYALERMWGKDLDDSAADEADTTDL